MRIYLCLRDRCLGSVGRHLRSGPSFELSSECAECSALGLLSALEQCKTNCLEASLTATMKISLAAADMMSDAVVCCEDAPSLSGRVIARNRSDRQ